MEIHSIQFTGKSVKALVVDFPTRVTVINGASNTGKSFLIDCLDYMLGKELIDKIDQSEPYTEISLQLSLNSKPYTLFRGFPSKEFELFNKHIRHKKSELFVTTYKVGTLNKGEVNLNQFFMNHWHQINIKLAKNLTAEKVNLTIRLLSVIICSDEERIINKNSPIESRERVQKTINRNLFNYLLTGTDSSSFEELAKKDSFDAQKSGRLELLTELISNFKDDVDFENESIKSLKEHQLKIEETLSKNESILVDGKLDISEMLSFKKKTSQELGDKNEKLNNLNANLINFEHLIRIYNSDIDRLESQEEAAFLLSINHDGHCGFCGIKSENIFNDLSALKLLNSASLAEIEKIKINKLQLDLTIDSVRRQKEELTQTVCDLNQTLKSLEKNISLRTPVLEENLLQTSLLMEKHSNLQRNIKQLEIIEDLQRRLELSDLIKAPKPYKTPDFYLQEDVINEFCGIYSEVLTEINYSGNKVVTFDFKKYDVLIDGNPRHLNGKGVRAILHSVFKISTMLYCSRKRLFHPKLIILDSPLLTYRDPTVSKHGELSDDEKALVATKLSDHFLSYLEKISDMAQFIIIENVDVPEIVSNKISVETFHGESSSGRRGLF